MVIYIPNEPDINDSYSDDEEDEAAELMRELDKIKKERLAQKEKEVSNHLLVAQRLVANKLNSGTRTSS